VNVKSSVVQIGGVFDTKCGPAYVSSAAAAVRVINKMNSGQGLAVGPNKDFYVTFNFTYALYPEGNDHVGYNTKGFALAQDIFRKVHLIVGEGGGCNHHHGLNMTHVAIQEKKILMAASGPSDFYKSNSPYIFGMHIPSESYPRSTIFSWSIQKDRVTKEKKVKTAAMIYYGSGKEHGATVQTTTGTIKQKHNGRAGSNNLFTGGVINEGAIEYCRDYGIEVLSVESYGDDIKGISESAWNSTASYATMLDGIIRRAIETKADVLIMSTLFDDGGHVIRALDSYQQKSYAINHRFKGVWTTGVPWGGGSCYGTYEKCTHTVGATQSYNGIQDFTKDPLLGKSSDFSKLVSVNDFTSGNGGAKIDVGAIVSAYAQAFQKGWQYKEISDRRSFMDDPTVYEHFRNALSIWEGETIFGNVRFNRQQRNEGREPATVQLFENSAYDASDSNSRRTVAQLLFPQLEATEQMTFPVPATHQCDVKEVKVFSDHCFMCNKCTSCRLPNSKPVLAGGDPTQCTIIQEDLATIPPGYRIAGYVLSCITIAMAVFCAGWTYWHKKSTMVKLSQPLFFILNLHRLRDLVMFSVCHGSG